MMPARPKTPSMVFPGKKKRLMKKASRTDKTRRIRKTYSDFMITKRVSVFLIGTVIFFVLRVLRTVF